LGTVREDPVGTFNFNTVFNAQSKVIANLANAKFNTDALPFGQAKDKFLAKDGDDIDAGDKKIINGLEAVDDYDYVVKKQLDDLDTELRDLIDNIGGSGGSILDIISLFASLTSLAASLAALGLKAGTALTSAATIGGTLLNGVMAISSLLKNSSGNVVGQATQKIANGVSLEDYAPDPNNWVESQQDLDRLRQGARDVEADATRPPFSVGASWFDSVLSAPIMMQRQMLNAFQLVA